MENIKRYLPITLRIIISFLFLLSAVAKMYPSPYFAISTFEVKQLYPMGFSEDFAVYFSRTLIGIEFALGLLLLQPHYLKKLVIPATILMLVVFIVHLTIDTISNGGNSGNCGCFGSLMPMTPIEAIIKNVIAVALLVWLLKILPAGYDRTNFWVLTTVVFASVLMVFMLAPIQPRNIVPNIDTTDTFTLENVETPVGAEPEDTTAAAPVNAAAPAENKVTEATKAVASEPAAQKSVYSQYFANADKGKKIIALFVPGCEHCRDAAKEITEMKKRDKSFPDMQIIFMDEEAEKIPEFFDYAGAKYPYKVIDVITFWKLLGNSKDTPGVIYLWNGNIIKDWEGTNANKFVGSDLAKSLKKPYSEIKK